MLKPLKHSIKSAIIIALLFVFSSLLWMVLSIKPVSSSNKNLNPYFIHEGTSFNEVIKDLTHRHLLRSYTASKIVQTFYQFSLKKGLYYLSPSMSTYKILLILNEGKSPTFKITFPEGFSIFDMANKLKNSMFRGIADDFIKSSQDPYLLNKYSIPANTAEGFLFPSTYYIPADFTGKQLVELMLKTFFNKIHSFAPKNFSVKSIYKNIILASIVEKEAVVLKDRPLIASVFLNRIAHNMRLESCATIIYIFSQQGITKNRVFFKDLQIQSPYNTYRNKGLPPAPISNPGLSSIKASFYPAQTNYLFFVYKGNGEHIFNTNYKDHLRDYKHYIKYQNIKKNKDL